MFLYLYQSLCCKVFSPSQCLICPGQELAVMWFLALCPKWFTLFPLQTASLLVLQSWKESCDFSLAGNKVQSSWGKQACRCYLISLKSAVSNLLFHYCVSVLSCEQGEIPCPLQLLLGRMWSNSTSRVPSSRNSGQLTHDSVMTLALAVSSRDMAIALKLWAEPFLGKKKTRIHISKTRAAALFVFKNLYFCLLAWSVFRTIKKVNVTWRLRSCS